MADEALPTVGNVNAAEIGQSQWERFRTKL